MSSTPPATPPTASGGSPSNPRTDSTPPSTRARQASLAVAGRKEIGDFWIGKVLGEGAFARVFAARLKDASKADFAIKVMEKKFIVKEGKSKEVQMERRVLSEVDHPNIVRLHYSFHDKERLYMVLDLCPGGELARVIRAVRKDGRALREPDARFYLCETVQAVQYLHGLGIIHRDIKPENVLLSASGHVKLTDFGTAKDANVKQELGEDGRPRKDTFCGTAEYVSPEVLQDGVAGVGADLWALGCMLFAMLVGRTPFVTESEYLTFQRILGYAGAPREPDDPAPDMLSIDFPPGPVQLSAQALDLVRALCKPLPEERLAVGAPKEFWAHAFVAGAAQPSSLPPPELPYPVEVDAPTLDGAGQDWLLLDEGSDDAEEFSGRLSRPSSTQSSPRPLSTASSASSPAKSVDVADVLLKGEAVLLQGAVGTTSHAGLIARKRHLVLTDRGRLLVVDPAAAASSRMVKAEVPLAGAQVSLRSGGKEFQIALPAGRAFRFKDHAGGMAPAWKEAIDKFV